jgi:hypothetical protein
MSKTKDEGTISTKGWNWGYYHMNKDKIAITNDKEGDKKLFDLSYKDIAISNASQAHEVTLEFQ